MFNLIWAEQRLSVKPSIDCSAPCSQQEGRTVWLAPRGKPVAIPIDWRGWSTHSYDPSYAISNSITGIIIALRSIQSVWILKLDKQPNL